jgi:hypothetical protein
MNPTNKSARIAGAIYLSMVLTGPFPLIYIPNTIYVRGNPVATAANVLAHETMFRLGMVAEMAGMVIFVLVAMALYRLFKNVNAMQAVTMVALVLVSAAVGFMNVLNNVAALTLFRGTEFLTALDKPQRDALGMLFLRLHGQGNVINELFWGLWLLPFGVLVIRSGFLPRILGVLLIINGLAYVVQSFTAILLPDYLSVVERIAFPALLGELWIMLWLLIMGARVRTLTPAAA